MVKLLHNKILLMILFFFTKPNGLFGIYTDPLKSTAMVLFISRIIPSHNEYYFFSCLIIYTFFLFQSLISIYFNNPESKYYCNEPLIDKWISQHTISHIISIVIVSLVLSAIYNQGHLYFLFSTSAYLIFVYFFKLLCFLKNPHSVSKLSKKIFRFFSPALLFITPLFWWPDYSITFLSIKNILAILSPIYLYHQLIEYLLANFPYYIFNIMIFLLITLFISIIIMFKSYTYSMTTEFIKNSKLTISKDKVHVTPVEGFLNIRTKHIILLLDNMNVKPPTFISNKKKAMSNYSDIESFAMRLYILMLLDNENIKINNPQKELLLKSRKLLLESFEKAK